MQLQDGILYKVNQIYLYKTEILYTGEAITTFYNGASNGLFIEDATGGVLIYGYSQSSKASDHVIAGMKITNIKATWEPQESGKAARIKIATQDKKMPIINAKDLEVVPTRVTMADFFANNKEDLADYFKITDLNQAIYDTMSDAAELECLILDVNPDVDLDLIFRPLENQRASEMLLGKEKAKGKGVRRHASWLRLYAIRFQKNAYLITGGAIKLTGTMQEREHTLEELRRLEMVRNMLIGEGVTDLDGFSDLVETMQI